jgi:hypothetical protein
MCYLLRKGEDGSFCNFIILYNYTNETIRDHLAWGGQWGGYVTVGNLFIVPPTICHILHLYIQDNLKMWHQYPLSYRIFMPLSDSSPPLKYC